MGGGCADCLTTEFELNVSKFQYDNQSNKGDQKLYKRLFGNINIDNLKDFLLQHMPATESYCSQRKNDPNKLLLGSDLYPVSYTHLTLPTTLHECRSRWSPYH